MLPQRAAGSSPLKAHICRDVDEVRLRGGFDQVGPRMVQWNRVNRPSNETVWGRLARTGEIHFFPSPPSLFACPVRPCLCFWHNPIVCTAQTSGLLKQPDQVELNYSKCSPSGVSHFQGPHEHMRHSCETGRNREGVAIWNSFSVLHLVHPI